MAHDATKQFSEARKPTQVQVQVQKTNTSKKPATRWGPEYFNRLMYSCRNNIAEAFVNSNLTFKSITQDFEDRFSKLRPLANNVEDAIRPFLIGFGSLEREEGRNLSHAASLLFKASCRMVAVYLKIFCWDEVVKVGYQDQVQRAAMHTPDKRGTFEYENMPSIVLKMSFHNTTILKHLLTICNDSRFLIMCDKSCDQLVTGVLRARWTNIDRELRIFESLGRPMCDDVAAVMEAFRRLTTGNGRLGIEPGMGPYIVALTRCYISMWQFLSVLPTVKAPHSPGIDICTAVHAVKPLTRAVCDVVKQFAWHFGMRDMRDVSTKEAFKRLRYDEVNRSFFPVNALVVNHQIVLEDISVALEAAIDSGHQVSEAIRRAVYDRLDPVSDSRLKDFKYKSKLLPIVKYFENEDFVGELAAGIAFRGIYWDQKCSLLRMHYLAIIQRRSLELEALYCVGAFTGTSFCDKQPKLGMEEEADPPKNPFRCIWAFEKGFTEQVVNHIQSLIALLPRTAQLGKLDYPWPELSRTVKADLERVQPAWVFKPKKETATIVSSLWQRIFGAVPRKEDRLGSRRSLAGEGGNVGCCF